MAQNENARAMCAPGGRFSDLFYVAASCLKSPRTTPIAESCGGSDTAKVPITDLGSGCYLKYRGGLYPDGTNELSGALLGAGRAAAAQVVPLDTNGKPSAGGKYVMLSVGMSNTTGEFCNDAAQLRSCVPQTFMAQ